MKKFKSIFSNTVRSLMTPLLSMLLSIIVINYYTVESWGYFVERLLVMGIVLQLLNWGNRELLLREFSNEPSRISQLFSGNIFNRALLLLPALLPMWLLTDENSTIPYLLLWLISAFIYQSFEVVVIYKKSFLQQILIEAVGFIVTISGVLNASTLNGFIHVNAITEWYAIGIFSKMLFMLILERKEIDLKAFHLNLNTLKQGVPFLLIGLGGSLVTKADIYILSIYGDTEDLGRYQVLINLLIYLQALAAFVSTPFTRHMYRIPGNDFRNISIRFSLIGAVLTIISIPIIYLIMVHVYGLYFSLNLYVIATFCVLPIYFYLPIILRIYRAEKEKIVMMVNFIAAGVSAVFTYFLYKNFGITGAILSVALIQVSLAMIYFLIGKKYKIQTSEKIEF